MSQPRDDDPSAWPAAEVKAPGPGAELTRALADKKPVRARSPVLAFVLVLAAAAVLPIATIVRSGTRPDLPALPLAWVIVMAALWLLAAVVPLALAVVPRRGTVLPNGVVAFRVAVSCAVAMVVLGLFTTVDAPGVTHAPPSFASGFWHCAGFGAEITLLALVVAALALRRVYPIGERRVAAALGAGFGALAGLTLHFVCPMGGGLHVGLAHGGGVVLGAALGALLFARPLRA